MRSTTTTLKDILLHLILLFMCIVMWSCRKGQDISPSGCCGMPAFNERIGIGSLYIPNIFTPDGDGINDELIISGDSISYIEYMEIRDERGRLVLYAQYLPVNMPYGWDGSIHNGVVKKGIYTLKLRVVFVDLSIGTVEARTCNYPCGNLNEDELIPIDRCQFGDQVNEDRIYDPTIPTSEPASCFR